MKLNPRAISKHSQMQWKDKCLNYTNIILVINHHINPSRLIIYICKLYFSGVIFINLWLITLYTKVEYTPIAIYKTAIFLHNCYVLIVKILEIAIKFIWILNLETVERQKGLRFDIVNSWQVDSVDSKSVCLFVCMYVCLSACPF